MDTIRLAIIGVGWAGTRQARAVREVGRKVIVECLVDNDAEHLRASAQELDISKTYAHYEQALDDIAVDAISICTPHALHCPMAVQAAQAGKHVLVEKPMALTVSEATRMIEAARTHRVHLYVAESAVYTSLARTLREIVQTGRHIGEVTFASIVAGFRGTQYGYPGRRAWLSTPEQGGTGTWMLHGIHTAARLRYVLGEVATVYARQHRATSFSRADLEGTVSALLTLESGVHVALVQSPETRLRDRLAGYTICGDRGSIRAWNEGYDVFTDQGVETLGYPQQEPSGYAQEIEAFADLISGTAVGPTTAESERRSLAIVQAGYESMESGSPVSIRDRFGELQSHQALEDLTS